MTYPNRNRSAEKKARKKRDILLLLNLILLIFIVTGGIFLWKEYSNSQQEASKPEASQVSKASPSEEASQPSSVRRPSSPSWRG